MTNIKAKQGLEWDGSRPTSSSTLDRLREKVSTVRVHTLDFNVFGSFFGVVYV